MIWDFAETTTQKARRDYHCDASDWISNISGIDYNEEDWDIFLKAKNEDFKILKGTMYTKTKGKWEGEFSIFRARVDLNDICLKYDLYTE